MSLARSAPVGARGQDREMATSPHQTRIVAATVENFVHNAAIFLHATLTVGRRQRLVHFVRNDIWVAFYPHRIRDFNTRALTNGLLHA